MDSMDSMQKLELQACLTVTLPRNCGHQDYRFLRQTLWSTLLALLQVLGTISCVWQKETHNCGTVPWLSILDFALQLWRIQDRKATITMHELVTQSPTAGGNSLSEMTHKDDYWYIRTWLLFAFGAQYNNWWQSIAWMQTIHALA